jgi:hypothetical protein
VKLKKRIKKLELTALIVLAPLLLSSNISVGKLDFVYAVVVEDKGERYPTEAG